MAITGRKAYLEIDGEDFSTYLDGITPSNNQEELDGTTFQPDVANPQKDILYGFEDNRFALSGKWSPEADTAFRLVNGQTDLDYNYGPQGHAATNVRIYGTCNIGKYSGPISTVAGITTFTAEMSIKTQSAGTFPVVLTESAPEAGKPRRKAA